MPFSKLFLYFTVFLTGAAVLILEVVAVRVLAPFFGNTIFSVSSILSVVLAALSLGYYLGGRLADRRPSSQLFYSLIIISGLATLLVKISGSALLPLFSLTLPLTTGPLISSFCLFLLPALILGTLSPFAIKLSQQFYPSDKIGQASGTIFFWSTAGSLFGSLSAGFLLIPRLGTDQIIIATGLALVILGTAGLKLLRPPVILSIIAVTLGELTLISLISPARSPQIVYSGDGIYQKILIRDTSSAPRTRYLIQDKNTSAAIYLESPDHVFAYTQYYSLYKTFFPSAKKVLVIGGGAYTIPKSYLADSPDFQVDVAEIEPGLYLLARKYFILPDSPRLTNITADGRSYLARYPGSYDIIFADAYSSFLSIPGHLVTREFFRLAKSRLSPDGLFIGNFIGSITPTYPSYFLSQLKTFTSVFPAHLVFTLDQSDPGRIQNLIFVGFNQPPSSPSSSLPSNFKIHLLDTNTYDLTPHPVFTDNYNPAEYILAQTLTHSF
ncbi:hypothetical protein A3E17_01200 [Candidatus Amesbacteria bacterium RIFCSPHIGHO2_12_FULL_48_14]|uniref:PABS domain-containing protein n=2 Tax=Candidatus Amesiibacteriota TaxID=1752730 RepID=A0A1F4Z5T8_9BACT|nr:MAG: Spermine synthase [Candidatus Amesbacteria bacterium GW2011_GWA1_48_9]OGC89166.1 MAG: hypothetical protein A2V48_00820 [Candidatus Amesbacteria bacterium RBG_19FT_COMBO_48_16]OGC99313.1 MAG: hypothetical protein A2W16_03935 [Candidatus Amesbacteria bacterium RBG_16_48_31]OGD01571.1 MAG: hypothetical protein A3E17_01200 [Candidatus Amesbacteria bacterium RIFCSPHIGHO2_12_FULL_48_14]